MRPRLTAAQNGHPCRRALLLRAFVASSWSSAPWTPAPGWRARSDPAWRVRVSQSAPPPADCALQGDDGPCRPPRRRPQGVPAPISSSWSNRGRGAGRGRGLSVTRRDGVLDTAWPWRAGVGASVVQQVGPPGRLSPVNFPTFRGAISPSICPLRSLLHCPGLARPAKGGEPTRLCHRVTVCTKIRVCMGASHTNIIGK